MGTFLKYILKETVKWVPSYILSIYVMIGFPNPPNSQLAMFADNTTIIGNSR